MRRFTIRLLTLFCVAAWQLSGTIGSADDTVIFKDSFSDVKGHSIRQTDGKVTASGGATRRLAGFMGTSDGAQGKYVIEAVEDYKTLGADKQPGVLAITLRSIPDKAAYGGVVYFGGLASDKALTLKEIAESPKVERLKQIKVTFKYRAENAVNADDVGATYDCRLEPNASDPYSKRLGLGLIHATAKWKTFAATLDRGTNVEAFLRAVADAPPRTYKLVWAQSGLITSYQIGDTLLIDDVEIFRLP